MSLIFLAVPPCGVSYLGWQATDAPWLTEVRGGPSWRDVPRERLEVTEGLKVQGGKQPLDLHIRVHPGAV